MELSTANPEVALVNESAPDLSHAGTGMARTSAGDSPGNAPMAESIGSLLGQYPNDYDANAFSHERSPADDLGVGERGLAAVPRAERRRPVRLPRSAADLE